MYDLYQLNEAKKEELGLSHTPKEIIQQPRIWEKTLSLLLDQKEDLSNWIKTAQRQWILTGAGTSEYAARCVSPALKKGLPIEPLAVGTTEIVIDPTGSFPSSPCTLVSFARSGQSPESVAAYQLTEQLLPGSFHLAITCNAQGELAKKVASHPHGYVFTLPPESNDKGLAMTSSYSSLVLAGMGLSLLDQPGKLAEWVGTLADSAERIIKEYASVAKEIAGLDIQRAVYLGSGPHFGTALEGHLKIQELTGGMIVAKAESTLGLRHGPMAAITENTVIVMYISGNAYARKYELDLLKEIKLKQLGLKTVVIGDNLSDSPELADLADYLIETGFKTKVDDALRAPVYIVWPQMLAVYASLNKGLKPDTPSAAGVINRVVAGVVIHPY
jgi:tagatose-6-phosphate ketose/aldose isomerase